MSLKICTIGCGTHSTLVHGLSLRKYVENYPDTILAGCCDYDREKADAYKEKFEFRKAYTDMYEMLEQEKPNAVCIIVPEKLICETSISVMELGYHVLLEKPPGLCKADTLRMIETANRMGIINHVAFNRRYLPLITKLKRELKLLTPGSIQNIFYEFYRYNRREGSFETTAIHGIDVVKDIIGNDYRHVRFSYQEMPECGEKVANIFLECTFDNGVMARLNFCPCTGVEVDRVCVNSRNHTFLVKTPIWNGFDTPGEFIHVDSGHVVERMSGDDLDCGAEMFVTNGFYDENAAFFENVRAGRPGTDTIASALQAVEIAEAIKNRKTEWIAGKRE